MATKQTPLHCRLQTLLILVLAAPLLSGATLNLPLGLPQLTKLEAGLAVNATTVDVNIKFTYNDKGAITITPDSTVDGLPVTGRATIKRQGAAILYTVNITGATHPRTVVSLKGDISSNSARVTYAGPQGRARGDQQVTLTTADASAVVDFSPVILRRGRLGGNATINAYGTTPSATGKVAGTLTPAKLTLSLKQGSRLLSFSGTAVGVDYVGTLKVTILPDRETIKPFTVPGSAFNPPGNPIATFRGTVLLASNSIPEGVAGVQVTLRSDRNGDGDFTGDEVVTTQTDDDGRYSADVAIEANRPVLLEISRAGYAKYMNSYPNVAEGSTITKNATLQALNTLTVSSGNAESSDGKLMITGLPAAISNMSARVFNPTTETAQFPGEFADSDQNLLVSSVFAAIEASDTGGQSVTNLGTNAVLSMEVPQDTWRTMGDLTPGNGQIDVPLYFYSETTGQWVRSAPDGWLETSNHIKIPESDLPAIKAGTYAGRVYSVGQITHLSYWNCDWPIDTHASIHGIVVDENGTPVNGANVSVRGTTYTGTTSPKVTGADGFFCADVMRSEALGEDVDRDDVTGETHRVQITVRAGTNVYSFGPFNTPLTQSTCESGGGADLGNLVLAESNRLTVTLCTISGHMVFSGTTLFGSTPSLQPGDPIAGATVYGYDEEAWDFANACLLDGSCTLFAVTDANGDFTLTVPVLSGVSLFGYKFEPVGQSGYDYFLANATTEACPNGSVTISADFWSVRYLTLALAGNNGEIGSVSAINNQLTFSLTTTDVTPVLYFGVQATSVTRPSATGPWFTVNVVNASTGGTNTAGFSVTTLSPLAGTWSIAGTALSGTFAEQGASPSGISEDAEARIEAQRRMLNDSPNGPGLQRMLPPTRFTPARSP